MANLRPVTRTDPELPLGGEGTVAGVPGPRIILTCQKALPYTCTTHVALVTEALDAGQGLGPEDVWEDAATRYYVAHQCAADEVPARELRRIMRRAKAYRQVGGQFLRILANGVTRECPHPDARE